MDGLTKNFSRGLKFVQTKINEGLEQVQEQSSAVSGRRETRDEMHQHMPPIRSPSPHDPVLVRYSLMADKDCGNAYVIPNVGHNDVTGDMIRKTFPLPGNFHFRYMMHSMDDMFPDYIWADIPDYERVPLYNGNILVRGIKIPDNVARPAGRPSRTQRHPQPPPAQPRHGSPAPDIFDAPSRVSPDVFHSDAKVTPPPDLWPASPKHTNSLSASSGMPSEQNLMDFPATVKAADLDRAELVRQRLAKKEAAIAEKLNKHRENVDHEERKKVEKLEAARRLDGELDKWAKTPEGEFKDLRTLIGTLQTVMWPNSGWVEVSMATLCMSQMKVKGAYRRAILLCHPDRHQNADSEQHYRADRIFNALNEAWKAQKDA